MGDLQLDNRTTTVNSSAAEGQPSA
jgi:hypothetical protein